MTASTTTIDLILQGLDFALSYWWAYLPFMLGSIAYSEWAEYQRAKYLAGMKWVLLEMVPPPDVLRSPKIAESFFAGLHSSYGGGISWKSGFFSGKVPDWFSLELVSNGGDIKFFVRCTEGTRALVETSLFAQYPDAEIRQSEDYIKLVPDDFDPVNFDVSGTEFAFTKESAFPIKTWPEFEEAGGKDADTRIDPLAPLLEMMSALRPGEHLWLQYVIRPTGGDWIKDSQKVIDKLKGKKEEAPKSAGMPWPFSILETFLDGLMGLKKEEKKEEKLDFNLQKLTASERKVLEQVEFKLAKPAFKSTIRVLYVSTKESFNGARPSGVSGMFRQLFYNNLNSFKSGNSTKDKGIMPWLFIGDKGFLAEKKTIKKKKDMYKGYRGRSFMKDKDLLILNIEELATLWHLPGMNVRAPLIPRVQAKKGQPPVILPTR